MNCIYCSIELKENNFYESYIKKSYYTCKSCKKLRNKDGDRKLKTETFNEYGGKCSCCGVTDHIFLSIDHIDGQGSKHRKELSSVIASPRGRSFYNWLKRNGYPKDNYCLLCFNCNFAKHVLGACPHQNAA